jgi:hypothetical protein
MHVKSDAKMKHHLVGHDPIAIQQNKCVLCNFEAVNADRNRLHYIKEHNRFAKVACPGCDAVFIFPKALATHVQQCLPHYTPLQTKHLVDQLPPINEGDGEPNPARFQQKYIKRTRGKYKNTKTTRQAGTAPVNRGKVVANVVRVAKRKVAPPEMVALTPETPRLTFSKPWRRRTQHMEINVATRRFALPITPPQGLILVSEFDEWQQQQQQQQQQQDSEEEEKAKNEQIEEEQICTYSYNMDSITFSSPHNDEDSGCPFIPSIRMSDLSLSLINQTTPLPLEFFLS